MSHASTWSILVDAALVNNFVLAYFLGICPFLGVSAQVATATRMGAAVTFVMLLASVAAYLLDALLTAIDAPYLRLVSYVVVIASAVQLVELFVRNRSPALYRALGIFLPLITTNCAILAVALFQTQRGYDFVQCVAFALGAGLGFTLALTLMAGLRERLELSQVPDVARGAALTLMLAGVLSLAFMGFGGFSA